MTERFYPELDETVFRETLGCGLPLAVVPRQGFSKKLCYLAVDFGSVHTDFTLEGKVSALYYTDEEPGGGLFSFFRRSGK